MNNDITDTNDTRFREARATNSDKKISPRSFNFHKDGIIWGIVGGIGMALFLVGAQVMTGGNSMILKFFKYIVLGAVLMYGLGIQKSYLKEDYNFINGIQLGGIVTVVSAITLALMNILLFSVTDNLAFDKFSMEADTVGHVSTLSGVLLFEVLVFGMIMSFIILQFIKPKIRGAKKPS